MRKMGLIIALFLGFGIAHEHSKESDLTFKQVMQMVNQSALKMLQGFLLNNDTLLLEGAKEIAEHPMPKGGPLRYMDPSKREDFARHMPAFERQVHGGAEEVIRFVREGKRDEAFRAYTQIIQGCMACHELFRDSIKGR
ncbi:MAG: hypothetical protein ACK4SM_01555 [Aquificaceae bacterium]